LDKIETGRGHLGGSVEYSEGKGWESIVAILRFVYVSPHLCRLRTDGLVSVSKYWTCWSHTGIYGPSNPPSTEDGFTFIASMAALREKLGTDPRIGQTVCCALCREPFFSRAVASTIAVDNFTKDCHVCGLTTGSVRGTYVD
jgi:hypothetical protein